MSSFKTTSAVLLGLSMPAKGFAQSFPSQQFFLHNPPKPDGVAVVRVLSQLVEPPVDEKASGRVRVECASHYLDIAVVDPSGNGVWYTQNDATGKLWGGAWGAQNIPPLGTLRSADAFPNAKKFKESARINLNEVCPGGKVDVNKLDEAIQRMLHVYAPKADINIVPGLR